MSSVSLTSLETLKYDWERKAREIFSFLPLINNSVTILNHMTNHIIKNYQYFIFFIWFAIINIPVNIAYAI